tara:strand:- start:12636 stop:14039 length:1404 start_codon:yes stop_codon:yes gene_type:complete
MDAKVLNASRETRAQAILDCCELAARGINVDYSDKTNSDALFVSACVQNLISKLRYMAPRAAAGWRPEFGKALDQAHSARIEYVPQPVKEGVRARKMRCMACGRFEKNCTNRLDLAGPFASNEWVGPTGGILGAFQRFKKNYHAVFGEDYLDECVMCDALPPEDLGSFMIGETCLRKAQLYFQCRTLLLECAYDSEQILEAYVSEHKKPLDDMQLYTINSERIDELIKKLDKLEMAVADERRPTPPLEIDPSFWQIIDQLRTDVSNGCNSTKIRLLRERAYEVMGLEEEGWERNEDNYNEGPRNEGRSPAKSAKRKPVKRPPKRKRANVVTSDPESENSDTDSQGSFIVEDEDEEAMECAEEDGDEDNQKDNGDEESEETALSEARSRRAVPSRPKRREPPQNVSSIASTQRIPGERLPARRAALYNLMELQQKLMRNGDDVSAAVCTAAIFNYQDMLSRVSEPAQE